MSTPAHTPGPWELFEHSWSDSSIYGGPKNEKLICKFSIYGEATEETQEHLEKEMDANARLIAAAPELLKWHQNIVALAIFDEDGPAEPISPLSWETIAMMALDYSCAAIAKATQP